MHPAVVHFPIALLTLAWVALVMRYAARRPDWERYAWQLELGALVTMPLAILSALIDTRGIGFLTTPRWDDPLIWHSITGTTALVVVGLHVWWRARRARDAEPATGTAATPSVGVVLADLGGLSVGLWLVTVTGLIGGEMVFGA